jgi:hypothetical protein
MRRTHLHDEEISMNEQNTKTIRVRGVVIHEH